MQCWNIGSKLVMLKNVTIHGIDESWMERISIEDLKTFFFLTCPLMGNPFN
jgi:hypothetical protein